MRWSTAFLVASAAIIISTPTIAANKHTQSASHWSTVIVGSGDDTEKRLCVLSTNIINLDWPYAPAHVRFCINGDKEDLAAGRYNAYLELVGTGQVMPDEGLSVRIDNQSPIFVRGIGSSSGSDDIVFLYEDVQIVRLLNTAKVFKVKATYLANGPQTAVFNVKGLPVHVGGLTTIESMQEDDALKSAATPADRQAVITKYDCIRDGSSGCATLLDNYISLK